MAIAVAFGLVVAGVLILLGGDDDGGDGDDGFDAAAAEVCTAYTERIQSEFELSFPEGPPTPEAEADYLSHAFVDTVDELVAELEALEPTGDDAAAVESLAAASAAVRADPSLGIGTDPFVAEVRPAFDDAGIEACGSGFLAT